MNVSLGGGNEAPKALTMGLATITRNFFEQRAQGLSTHFWLVMSKTR